MTKQRRADLPPRVRPDFARALPTTADREARTVEVTWATGSSAPQIDPWTGEVFAEELDMSEGAVDLTVLNRGAPILNAHNRRSLGDVIGVVERAWLDGGEGRAMVRFADREDVKPIMADVMDGILRNLSVGYRVRKYSVEKSEEGQPTVYRAIDWQPFEVSFVPVGADPAAQVRASRDDLQVCKFIYPEDSEMKDTPPNKGPAASAGDDRADAGNPPADQTTIRQEGARAEQQRAKAIRERCRALRLPEAFADKLIDDDVPLAEVSDKIVDEMARGSVKPAAPPAVARGSEDTRDNPAFVRQAMADALSFNALTRAGLQGRDAPALSEAAREYADIRSPLTMMAELARGQGVRIKPHLSKAELFQELASLRMHSTSDFPQLLTATANRVFQAAYEYQTPTFREVFAKRSFPDFRPTGFLRLGDFPLLEEKAETAEYTHGTLSESSNAISAKEYGRIVAISRKAMINDDLGALAQLPFMAGRRVAQWENMVAWATLGLNAGGGPAVTDTSVNGGAPVALFHASHGNLIAAGTAISVASLSVARAMMRKQVSLDGAKLNLQASILVVGPDQQTLAEQVLNSTIAPTTDGATNPFKGTLRIVVDAELVGNAWYLFADPMNAPVLVYGYVDGMEGPQIATNSPFDTNGLEMRVIEDFGTGPIDFRGVIKNNGA